MWVLSGCQSKIHKMRKQQTRHIQPQARTENNTNNLIISFDNLIIKLLVNLFVFWLYVLIMLWYLPPGFGVIFTMTLVWSCPVQVHQPCQGKLASSYHSGKIKNFKQMDCFRVECGLWSVEGVMLMAWLNGPRVAQVTTFEAIIQNYHQTV